jgi:hypothetical protein
VPERNFTIWLEELLCHLNEFAIYVVRTSAIFTFGKNGEIGSDRDVKI